MCTFTCKHFLRICCARLHMLGAQRDLEASSHRALTGRGEEGTLRVVCVPGNGRSQGMGSSCWQSWDSSSKARRSLWEIPGPENSSPVLSSIIATGHMKLLSTQNVAIIINKYWISKIVPKNVKYFYNVYMLVTFQK